MTDETRKQANSVTLIILLVILVASAGALWMYKLRKLDRLASELSQDLKVSGMRNGPATPDRKAPPPPAISADARRIEQQKANTENAQQAFDRNHPDPGPVDLLVLPLSDKTGLEGEWNYEISALSGELIPAYVNLAGKPATHAEFWRVCSALRRRKATDTSFAALSTTAVAALGRDLKGRHCGPDGDAARQHLEHRGPAPVPSSPPAAG